MQEKSVSYWDDTLEDITALRDIVDILYDGYCKVLRDDELCSTICKKIKDLQYCPDKEKRFKLLKIFNILNNYERKMNNNCNLNNEVVISILDEIYNLCQKILRELD